MKKFARDAILFITIQCVFVGLLYARYQAGDDYLASMNDKLDRIESSQANEQRRLILSGGSSVAWGTHSQILQDAVTLPVHNLGLHAGMGLSMRINEAKAFAREGDVLAMSIEWAVLLDAPRQRIMAEVAIACPRALGLMNWRDQKLVADGMLSAFRMPFGALLNDLKQHRSLAALSPATARARKGYRVRQNFNEFGDFQGHYGLPAPGFAGKEFELPTPEILRVAIERLNELYDWCQPRDITMVFFVPLVPDVQYARFPIVQQHVDMLVQQLKCPVLNADQVHFPDESFFDSSYHLQKEAGERRTRLLLQRLRPHLRPSDLR